MKKFTSFVLFLIMGIAFCSFGQDQPTTAATVNGFNQKQSRPENAQYKFNQRCDSLWLVDSSYTWERPIDVYAITEEWHAKAHNNAGRLTVGCTIDVSEGPANWSYLYSDTLTYYYDTLPHEQVHYAWDKTLSAWHKVCYQEMDETEKEIANEYLSWNYNEHQYEEGSRNEYSYYENGSLSESVVKIYDTLEHKFTDYSRTFHYYNLHGIDTLETYEMMNPKLGTWEITSKKEGDYNSDTRELISIDYTTEDAGQTWEKQHRNIYHFIDTDHVDTLEYAEWQPNPGIWKNKNKYLYSYDETGKMTEAVTQIYAVSDSTWKNQSRKLYVYDGDKPLKDEKDVWSGGKWLPQYMTAWGYENGLKNYSYFAMITDTLGTEDTSWLTKYSYDNHNNLLEWEMFYPASSNRALVPVHKEHNYWSVFKPSLIANSVANDFLVYPNPTEGVVHIRNTQFNNRPLVITISDIHGRIVSSSENQNARITIDLSKQPSGIYFIRISGNGKSSVSPVVVK